MPLEIVGGNKIVASDSDVCFLEVVDGSSLPFPPMQTRYDHDEPVQVDFSKGKVAKFNFRDEADNTKLRQAFVVCPTAPGLRGCGGMRVSQIEPGDIILLVFAITIEHPDTKRMTVVYNYTEEGLGGASFATHRIPDWERQE